MPQNILKPVHTSVRMHNFRFFTNIPYMNYSLGYVRFTNERRKVLNDEFPESDVLEITRKLAEEWNTMSEEIKRPYLLAAEEDKSRYKKETAEYNEKLVSLLFDMRRSTSTSTDDLPSLADPCRN